MNIQQITITISDQLYVWRAGDPVDDLRPLLDRLTAFVQAPLTIAIDPQPQLAQLPP